MAVFRTERFEVRPEAREQAERVMHEFASYVRRELPDSMFTTYRDASAPTRYIAFTRADHPEADALHRDAPGRQAFLTALQPLLASSIEATAYELVTSSDLAPRSRPEGGRAASRRPSRRR